MYGPGKKGQGLKPRMVITVMQDLFLVVIEPVLLLWSKDAGVFAMSLPSTLSCKSYNSTLNWV